MQRPLVCFYLPNSFYSSVHSVMLFDFFCIERGLIWFFWKCGPSLLFLLNSNLLQLGASNLPTLCLL